MSMMMATASDSSPSTSPEQLLTVDATIKAICGEVRAAYQLYHRRFLQLLYIDSHVNAVQLINCTIGDSYNSCILTVMSTQALDLQICVISSRVILTLQQWTRLLLLLPTPWSDKFTTNVSTKSCSTNRN